MLRQLRPALVSVLVLTALFGIVFPLAITGLAQAIFPHQAGGSLVAVGGRVVGSELIGQGFAAPGYFHPRPSAAGSGYDAAASAGTNLGPTSQKLVSGIRDLAIAYRQENGLPEGTPLPADAVTRSGSGLDPHVSPANAALQVPRVARARGMSQAAVRALVAQNTEGRQFGLLGEPRVNVLRLNLALDRAAPGRTAARS
jgi:K+-transporting ATPase ATPase C chain